MAGRPTKYTPETAKRILDALKAGATINAAIGAAGVSDQSFARWRERYGDFGDAITRAQAEGRLWHELNLRKAAEGDWRASLEYLSRRYPDDWRKREEMQHTGKDGQPGIAVYLVTDRPQDLT
jgi:hypothetical protein